jgi:hypothetical protein
LCGFVLLIHIDISIGAVWFGLVWFGLDCCVWIDWLVGWLVLAACKAVAMPTGTMTHHV